MSQETMEKLIKNIESNPQLKQEYANKAISLIQNKYKTKIDEKNEKINSLTLECDKIKKVHNPTIKDTKRLYSIEKSVKLLRSDISKLTSDMDFEIGKLFNVTYKGMFNSVNRATKNVDNINTDIVMSVLSKESIETPITTVTPTSSVKSKPTTITNASPSVIYKPWDRRMYRAFVTSNDATNNAYDVIPYNILQSNVSTHGYFPSTDTINEYKAEKRYSDDVLDSLVNNRKAAQNDILNTGVYAVNNPYALVTLYGSAGGEYLMDKKGRRSWYEVDNVRNESFGYAKNPSTTNIIAWGNADPYNRTPYQYSDFVLSKYWNQIPNNRLITLRRFAAPILDNLNFPGMDGISSQPAKGKGTDNGVKDNTTSSGSKVQFAPVATAITYFGDETNNKLSSILKFSAGLPWEDLTADVWKPEAPDPGQEGFETSYGLSSLLGKLNIFGGNWDFDAAMRKGQQVPDPYNDGPYANRIIGPVNAIKTVKKRKQGIDFKMDGMNIVFEYKARPIGGVNTKAIMLDILSNFLVMGTSNAIFFGGAHRFLSSPKGYPFLGGDAGKQAFYRGEPVKFAGELIQEATNNGVNIMGSVSDMMSKIWSAVKSFDMGKLFTNLGTGESKNLLSNASRAYLASRSTDTIPHLSGMRALLIGEPVGEWHLTIGNPMNPIALIGNLICNGIDVEFGDELGPDDFPLDIKVTVRLQHGMPRDKDAIQSIFNRGYGRIYALPDDFGTSADYNTYVDANTKQNKGNYYTSDDIMSGVQIASRGQMLGAKTQFSIQQNVMQGAPSVWNRLSFDTQKVGGAMSFSASTINNRTVYRNNRWIAESGLK